MTTIESLAVSAAPSEQDIDHDRHAQPRRRHQRRRRLVALILALGMLFPAGSYAQALRAPGGGGWQVQSVEWVRDHGGSFLVNRIENWWYGRHAPSGDGPPAGALPVATGAGHAAARPGVPQAPTPAAIAPLPGATRLVGEGRWVPGRTDPAGVPAMYTTFLRPDPRHASVVAGAAWIRRGGTDAHLVAGLRQPDGHDWPGGAHVPPADVPHLLATFNSGWKFRDISGGFYLDGRTGSPLKDGAASVVIDDKGRVTIGQWGRDVAMTAHVRAVRQNLDLVVDNGQPVSGLANNAAGKWGNAHNQLQYTWRSGLGTDGKGNLVYVAGHGLTLRTLADAMVAAGIQRGMELDIHPRMVTFDSWQPLAGAATPTKLLPDMPVPATRYLAADQRDFFYLTVR